MHQFPKTVSQYFDSFIAKKAKIKEIKIGTPLCFEDQYQQYIDIYIDNKNLHDILFLTFIHKQKYDYWIFWASLVSYSKNKNALTASATKQFRKVYYIEQEQISNKLLKVLDRFNVDCNDVLKGFVNEGSK